MGFTVWHNIVYSAKGGCGKTTFSSLFRIININSSNLKDKEIKNVGQGPLVLMDLDLLASNLGNAATDFIDKTMEPKSNENNLELFDYLVKNKPFRYSENYKIKYLKEDKGINEKFMLISSPCNEKLRGWFKAKRRYVPVVKYDDFRYGFMQLLRQMCDKNNYSEGSKSVNIVYDLPPNSDGYTEIVFDALLNINSKMREFRSDGEKVEHKFRLFVLSLPDGTIMNVNLNWLDNFLTESGSNISLDFKYFLVNSYSGKTSSSGLDITLKKKLENKGIDVVFLLFGNLEVGSNEHVIDKMELVNYNMPNYYIANNKAYEK